MFTKTTIAALFVGLAVAQKHPPTTKGGNPITKPLLEVVPACKAYTITWTPTTPNTVSIVLLKGPATNLQKVGPLAEGIPNSGSLSWTPDATLEASTGPSGYGLQLIDDVTGQFQYSTQFGISKDGCGKASSGSSASAKYSSSPAASGYSSAPPKSSAVSPTAPSYNATTVVQPSQPASYTAGKPTATYGGVTSVLPPQVSGTSAANAVQAGAGLVGAAAAAFAFLL